VCTVWPRSPQHCLLSVLHHHHHSFIHSFIHSLAITGRSRFRHSKNMTGHKLQNFPEKSAFFRTRCLTCTVRLLLPLVYHPNFHGWRNCLNISTLPFTAQWYPHVPPDLTISNCILPTECIYGFLTILRVNCDYFPKQH
jgi:hypothetical protein